MITSTMLTLFLLPVLYPWFCPTCAAAEFKPYEGDPLVRQIEEEEGE